MTPAGLALCACLAMLQSAAPERITVEIQGVTGELRQNVRAQLTIAQHASGEPVLEAQIRRLHDRAPDEIRRALQPFGHYRPTIDAALSQRPGGWIARYRIDPGDPIRIGRVDVDIVGPGADDPALRGVAGRHGLRPGEPLRHAAYENAKAALQNRAAATGYLDAALATRRAEVDTVAYSARVVFRLETGPRYRFGPVRFTPTPFEQAFLDRFVGFRPGEPFRLAELVLLQRKLSASDYFERVEVEPQRDAAEGGRVPILVRLRPKPRTAYSAGVGYGTETGPRGTLSYRRRWLNAAAHRLEADLRASLVEQTLVARFVAPFGARPDDRVTTTVAAQRDAFQDVESRFASIGIGLDHGRGDWREALSLRLQEEWFGVGGLARRSTLVVPEISWLRVGAEHADDPRRDSRLQLAVHGTSTAVGSDVSFLQATARARWARGLHPGGRLVLRLDAGATAVSALDDLPVSFRYFAGGAGSIRGFALRSAAPTDEAGSVIGGRHLLVGSIELEQHVAGPFAVAVFVDAGGAFDDMHASAPAEVGTGAGIRWQSPVGPVRLDVAWPASHPDPRIRLHFGVGGGL